MKQDNAFTGLEAAIVLIAFVVVAAVFSYVLLGAGFFATQKAQEVTYAGIQQTTSNMFLVGQVYGETNDEKTQKYLTGLTLNLAVPEGGQPQDVSEIQFLLSNDKGLPSILTGNGGGSETNACGPNPTLGNDEWCVSKINSETLEANDDTRLYPGDKAEIQIGVSDAHKITSLRGADHSKSFTLEIKPRVGTSYLISKTLSTGYSHGPLY